MRFAEAVTIRMPLDMHRGKTVQSADIPVDCSGRFSIYEGLKVCVPIITSGLGRYHRDSEQRNGLTDVEFNKALSAAGHVSFRRRVRVQHKVVWLRKWIGVRWIDMTNDVDLQHLRSELPAVQQYQEAGSLTLEKVVPYLTGLEDEWGIFGHCQKPL